MASPVNDLMVYYPLVAAVGGLLFWSGTLSQRVKTNEREIAALKVDADGVGTVRDRLTTLETLFRGYEKTQERTARSLEGVQRQLGDIAGHQQTGITTFPNPRDGHGD